MKQNFSKFKSLLFISLMSLFIFTSIFSCSNAKTESEEAITTDSTAVQAMPTDSLPPIDTTAIQKPDPINQ